MRTIYAESDQLRVGISPHYGARVVSLLDRRSGREWMTPGGESANTGEDAVYAGAEAVAWDECFPTVGTWDGSGTPWERPLRDHGDLWGRPWEVTRHESDVVATSYRSKEYVFSRELRVDGNRLVANYAVTNLLDVPLPYLWALHSLFAVAPGDRIELGGADTVEASFMSQKGTLLGSGPVTWRDDGKVPFPLNEVQPPDTEFMAKFVLGGVPGGSARLGQPGQWLEIGWDDRLDSLGIWITYGAWPAPGGHHEVALEPTSAPANGLGEAIAAGAKPLAPGEERTWQVTMTVTP